MNSTPNSLRRKRKGFNSNVYSSRELPLSPWWDGECERLVRRRRAAWFKYRNSKLRVDFLEFKKEEARCRCGLRKKKREGFERFCENLKPDSNPTYVWKKVRAFRNRYNPGNPPNLYNEAIENKVKDMIAGLCPPWVPV